MKKIYTWAAQPAQRNVTVADLRAAKGKRKFTQTTANTTEEARAAERAGIDLLIGNVENIEAVRRGSTTCFLTGAISMVAYPTPDDILRAAFRALELGADAIMTPRSMSVVTMLANEGIPVMGHLGLVPRRCTWRGGLRAVGKTADEAAALFRDFQRLEDAGAFSVESEVIPGRVLEAISQRCGLVTVSLGSGGGGDVNYLFATDIWGENEDLPRHARAFGELARLERELEEARVAAFRAFVTAANDGSFPSAQETAKIDAGEFDAFIERLDTAS